MKFVTPLALIACVALAVANPVIRRDIDESSEAAPTDAAPTDAAPTDAAPTDAAPTDAAVSDEATEFIVPTDDSGLDEVPCLPDDTCPSGYSLVEPEGPAPSDGKACNTVDCPNGATFCCAEGETVQITGGINTGVEVFNRRSGETCECIPPFRRRRQEQEESSTSTGDIFETDVTIEESTCTCKSDEAPDSVASGEVEQLPEGPAPGVPGQLPNVPAPGVPGQLPEVPALPEVPSPVVPGQLPDVPAPGGPDQLPSKACNTVNCPNGATFCCEEGETVKITGGINTGVQVFNRRSEQTCECI